MKLKSIICTLVFAMSFIGTADAGTVRGSVKSTDGKPLPGIVVSDGFTCVLTEPDGSFSLDADPQSSYVFLSVPSDYAIPELQGAPFIYKKISGSRKSRHNFVLRPIKPEKKFNLLAFADIQCRTTYHLRRFVSETVPDIRKTVSSLKGPSYGVNLGDLVYSESSHNANFILPKLLREMESDRTGLMTFQVNGNHDFDFENGCVDSLRNRSLMVRAKRYYEAVCGPRNYSFNRGDAHIVCMDDVISLKMGSHKHDDGFLPEQVEWLRQDLSFVPKDKLVILCVHVPFSDMEELSDESREVLRMLKAYDNSMILAGHAHFNRNVVLDCGIKEHVLGAVSGQWWWSNINADGTPNGYGVFSIDGNKVSEYTYKGVAHPWSYQIRAYRGDALMGGPADKSGMLRFPYGSDEILANVWNWEEGWTVELFENGRKTADFVRIPPIERTLTPHPGSSQDWWAIGFQTGILGRGNRKNRKDYCPQCYHLFKARLSDPACRNVKIVASDIYGNRYICRDILSGADYSEASPVKYTPEEAWDATDDNR